MNGKEVRFSIIFGIATLILTGIWTAILRFALHLNVNAADHAISAQGNSHILEWVGQIFNELIEIIGEELLAIIPFLFVLWLTFKVFKFNRSVCIFIAWIISSIIFGLMHMSTYDNQLIHVLLIQAGSRLFLTIPYIRYKNICASYITHITYDLIVFSFSFLTTVSH